MDFDRKEMSLEKCMLCGKELRKADMFEVFTGRVRYICPKCRATGYKELYKRKQAFRDSVKGRQIIENARKKK